MRMRGRASSLVLLLGALGSSALAMSPRHQAPVGQCRVTAGSKLSADLNKALCSEVKRAIAEAVPGSRFDAELTVVSSSRLAARLTVNGKALPKQNFAIMDSHLELDSIRQFARSLGAVAKTSKR